MKILMITPWYPDDVVKNHGVFIQEQAQILSARYEVRVISAKVDYSRFGWSSSQVKKTVLKKVCEYRLVVKKSIPFYNQFNYLLHFFIFFKQIVKEFQPDLIHANISYPTAFLARIITKQFRIPYVVTEHNSYFKNNFRSFFHRWATLWGLEKSAVIITVSNHSASQIREHINGDIQVVPNTIDWNRFSIAKHPSRKVTIGFLGSLNSPQHAKGLPTLLKALHEVDFMYTLLIGGGGRLLNEYQKMSIEMGMQDKCKFLGYIEYDQIPKFMHQIDFFVNVAIHESFGIAIVEAMASGVPIVCFNNGGPADFVTPQCGILIQERNIENLKKALCKMHSTYMSFDRTYIRNAAQKFDTNHFLDAIDKVYARVVANVNNQ